MEKYLEGQIAKHTINAQVFMKNPVGVAEHPDTVKTVAKLFEEYAEATEYLKLLRESRHEFAGQ